MDECHRELLELTPLTHITHNGYAKSNEVERWPAWPGGEGKGL